MKAGATIAFRYTGFAVLATAVNVSVQSVSLWLYRGPWAVTCAMAVGTVLGLLTKFLLDKYCLYCDREGSEKGGARQFMLYALMGGVATAVSWGVELLFVWYDGSPRMAIIGAFIGLTIGYALKYRLDCHFVFRITHAA